MAWTRQECSIFSDKTAKDAGRITMTELAAPRSSKGPSVTFLPDGTTHIVDLHVPLPTSISAAAANMIRLRNSLPDPTNGLTAPIEIERKFYDEEQAILEAQLLEMYAVSVESVTVGGVPGRLVTPRDLAPGTHGQLLVNLHGGAFKLGARSIAEAVPIAARTGLPVLAVDYRLAPEHSYPAAVDDTVAVYRALLETRAAKYIAIYGSSAGAVLAAQAVVRARQLALPLPAAIGFFSGTADFTSTGDTEALFGVIGLAPRITTVLEQARGYLADAHLSDPVLSPIHANLDGFPPTLCMSGTRDFFLSGTCNFHRALLCADVDARLVVFDAMPHVHWTKYPELLETTEALDIQARFLTKHLSS
jgi:acetyl esterase/lipase